MVASTHQQESCIDDKVAVKSNKNLWSFEFFPPKTNEGFSNLFARIHRMITNLHPAWVHVTWGAGGSTRDSSLELAIRVQKGILDPSVPFESELMNPERETAGCDVCLHLTCTNIETSVLDATLERAKRAGIKNILALRGDPPRGEEYWVASDVHFQHAIDLVRYIRSKHGDAFCIGVAGYPEGLINDTEKNIHTDLFFLKEKQDAGAKFIVTQFFYDVDSFLNWVRRCRKFGITIPIIPGIMPIQNYNSFRRMCNLCRVHVPTEVLNSLEPIKMDDAKVKEIGVLFAEQTIARVRAETDIRSFHIYTLNLERSTTQLAQAADAPYGRASTPPLVNADSKVKSPTANWLTVSGREMWDEFPNGRYGDPRSPAFGELDGYGASLKVPPADARRLWGAPVDEEDIARLFTAYVEGKLACIPWCDIPVWTETLQLLPSLLRLNRPKSDGGKSWWTVGSQPAVDGIDSSDPTFGFGPSNGFIFQKSFVEMFVTDQEKKDLVQAVESSSAPVTYFAGTSNPSQFETNVEVNGINAVTWGVFPGKEVAQSTIIEEQSFRAWCEEAFAIWREWELLFPPSSATHKILRSIHDSRWLVTVVHHDYKDSNALWELLEKA
ncbi:methylenetetrahydrofolate reductase [NAD(P)H] [Malassezia yamatoensis]|uniref:Methylenetetrahydrofolate reductase [NAD(P)H] n=1 Tax=Malassezia yamatoensis TaxID=253288 RepID=A0AAJ6CHZ0_9BASI|nr:methylenetetrahydrofolate reductase [NAD(P)H] [Malassezia yamatoensis]